MTMAGSPRKTRAPESLCWGHTRRGACGGRRDRSQGVLEQQLLRGPIFRLKRLAAPLMPRVIPGLGWIARCRRSHSGGRYKAFQPLTMGLTPV